MAHYLDVARTFGLGVSGGLDYHGAGTRRSEFFGVVQLPPSHYETLCESASRARERAAHRLGMAWGIA